MSAWRILVVDADPVMRETLARTLEPGPAAEAGAAFEVATASQGEEAVALQQEAVRAGHPFRAVFIDMNPASPRDGLHIAAALRNLEPSLFVVVTGAAADFRIDALQQALGQDVLLLPRPFPAEAALLMARSLRRCWETRRRLEQAAASERHAQARAIQEYESRYATLVQNIPGVVYRCALDEHWTIQFMSDFIETLSGYPLTDFIDNQVRSYASLIHPEDVGGVDAEVRAAVAANKTFILEYRIRHADGGIRWVHERGRASYDAAGNVAWLDGVITDVSERKQMEAALSATAEFVTAPGGADFAAGLVRHVAQTLGLDYVHVARLIPGRNQVETEAVWKDGAPMANWSYDLAHTPCSEVLNQARRLIVSGVQERYPLDADLARVGAESYVGEPIVDDTGTVLGLIVGITRTRLFNAAMIQANLRILAASMAAEWSRKEALSSLRAERDRTRYILQTAEAIIVALDLEGRITLINRKGCELLGYDEAELIGRDWFTTCLPDTPDPEQVRAVFRKTLEANQGGYEYYENPVRHRSGQEYLIAWHNSTLRHADGTLAGGMSAGIDITQKRRMETELHVALTKYKVLFETFPLGITIADPSGHILETNAAAERLLGVPREEHEQRGIDTPEWRIVRPDGSPMPAEEYASVRAMKEQRRVENVEMGIVREGQATQWISVTADLLPLDGYGVVVTYGDITARREAEERIRWMAYHDALTGLPNRRLLMDRLRLNLAASQRDQHFGAVLLLDLDRFKLLNDRFGHDVGDQLLIQAARRLSAQVREADTVARLGGDEFVVMLSEIGRDADAAARHAAAVGEKIREALATPYVLEGVAEPQASSASIGIKLFHGSRQSPEDLLKDADLALYRAKEQGRNQVRV